ncbi:biogenesis protein MshI [Shewanella intestini]|uniref:Biogenesis protein MshI n=1 Tax=Shewanella intestini TaxID=2017544 RepID=A0ABS5I4X0_9GAMM|nr:MULTISPECIES: biogenesis protein MshI [Shewanella]MBR9729072.1 biogenesis protein MshI [Shewanella intestini]MRG37148.1 biogenesis protein MshI [Shewanella sp. XMDDZSB0408]
MGNGFFKKLAFWQSTALEGEVGVYLSEHMLWLCDGTTEDAAVKIVSIAVVDGQWRQAFESIKSQYGLVTLQIVLAENLYQLLQADKPHVDQAEINQALIWQVKDMVTEPVTNIHLDYFETSVSNNDKVSVVVANRQFLVDIAVICDDLGLLIAGISIEEMTVTHLLANETLAHMVVMHLPGQELLFTVVKAGELLMQRRVRGFNQLDTVKVEDLNDGIADNLSLEIQRSMDYFESQLRQPPVASIKLLVEGEIEKLTELVAANFNQPVQAIAHDGVASFVAHSAHQELMRGAI